MWDRPSAPSLIGVCALGLLLVLLAMGVPTPHAHRDLGVALYDEECPHLRLVMNANRGGPPAKPATESDISLPTGLAPSAPSASFIPDIRLAPSEARAPPLPV
jgi:hypothetical protein